MSSPNRTASGVLPACVLPACVLPACVPADQPEPAAAERRQFSELPARPRAQTGRQQLGSRAMHGMVSAAILVLAYAVVAVAAGYTAVKVIRGGPHDG
ncbi:MAG TPA: hypothetical protein VHF26_16320 [Trebonia sp.]|nr:hypothetical protein [Trebonia sp.]